MDLVEWQPLTLQMRQGQAAAVVAVASIAAYWLTPRRISATELILLVGLGVAMLRGSRMIVWWAPLAAYFLAVHSGAIWKRYRHHRLLLRTGYLDRTGLAWTLAARFDAGCDVAALRVLAAWVRPWLLGKESQAA